MPLNEENGASDRAEDHAAASTIAAPSKPNEAALETALKLAEAGLKVFPCGADKKPIDMKSWPAECSRDPATIRRWFKNKKATTVGLPMGLNGLIAIDCDRPKPEKGKPEDGVLLFGKLAAKIHDETGVDVTDGAAIISTPSGGAHFIWKAPEGVTFGNGSGGLPPNIDVRGSHGYLIAVGSISPAGVYQDAGIATPFTEMVETGKLAVLPEPLQQLLKAQRTTQEPSAPAKAYVDIDLLIEALGLLENGGWVNGYSEWLLVAMTFARLSGGDERVMEAMEEWSREGDTNAVPDLFDNAARGGIEMQPGACAGNLAKWLGQHHIEGETIRAHELGLMITGMVDHAKVVEAFDDGEDSHDRAVAPTLVANNDPLPDIPGGVYQPEEAMHEISARFAYVDRGGEVSIVHRNSRGDDNTLARGSFETYLANVFVEIPVGDDDEVKRVPAARWWRSAGNRPPVRAAVFMPNKKPRDNEYNFWRGFGVNPVAGVDRTRSFLRHVRKVICRNDRTKYQYMIRWMAWKVQNPEKQAETSIVLKSESEGSGKSTVSEVMRVLFGTHATVIADPQQLLGNHNEHLEFVCFVQGEEALFAGDKKVADRVKQAITGPMLHINPKGLKAYLSPNHIGMILTTNHNWAVPAGKNARRWFVIEVDEGKVGDKAWFEKIYADLAAGGYGQLLRLLKIKKLGNWHPRQMPRTTELAEQQVLSASFVHQWLLAAASEGRIAAYDSGEPKRWGLDLGEEHTNSDIYKNYVGAANAARQRVESLNALSRALKRILGEENYRRNVFDAGKNEGRGWFIPKAEDLIRLIEKSLGVEEGAVAAMDD